MANDITACRDVTCWQGDVDGYVMNESKTRHCAYGDTEESAIATLEQKIDDAHPWWLAFGLVNCYKHGDVEISETPKITSQTNSWFNGLFKFFAEK